MSIELTPDEQGLKTKITTTAVLWAIVVALVAALLVFWLGGNAPDWVRWMLTIIVGALGGYFTFRLSYNSGVAKSVCKKCGTAFGIREVERHETVLGIEQKRKVERPPASKTDRGTSKSPPGPRKRWRSPRSTSASNATTAPSGNGPSTATRTRRKRKCRRDASPARRVAGDIRPRDSGPR